MMRIFPVAREGWPFILSGLFIFAICILTGNIRSAVLIGLITLCIALFFRDPERTIIQDKAVILSPADGRILEISDCEERVTKRPLKQVSVFMSVFNCHINRAPISGQVTSSEYNPGKYLPAFREKASILNEQNTIYIATGGLEMGVRQIAGLIARRIVCRVKPGDEVVQGGRFGLIRFGSRVDLLLPRTTEIMVKPGQKVKAGLNVIGRIGQEGNPDRRTDGLRDLRTD